MNQVNVPFKYIETAEPLVQKHKRYKFWIGGRGRGASENIAQYLVARSCKGRIKILGGREKQVKISESVYSIIQRKIIELQLESAFNFTDSEIINTITKSRFIFTGFNTSGDEDQKAQDLKAYDDVDILWIDEAQRVSRGALEAIDPTIRKPGSELIFSGNLITENDAFWEWGCKYELTGIDIFKTKYHETAHAMFICTNFGDNPLFPQSLEISRQKCLREHPEDYDHIWLGYPRKTGDYKSFFEPGLITAACSRVISFEDYAQFPLILGFDPSEGGDTAEVCKRQGNRVWPFSSYRIKDPLELANRFAMHFNEDKPDAGFIDAGYGAAVLAICKGQLKYNLTGIPFGGGSALPQCLNKRVEMYYNLREYLRAGGALPDDPALRQELNATDMDVRKSDGGVIQLISKDVIRQKIGRSPGRADALALTFAMPVRIKEKTDIWDNNQEPREQFNFGIKEWL